MFQGLMVREDKAYEAYFVKDIIVLMETHYKGYGL